MLRKIKKFSLPIFILEIIIYWITWYIYGYLWVNSINKVSDIFRVTIILEMLIIGFTAFLIIIQILNLLSTKKNGVKKIISVIVFIVFISIHLAMYGLFSNLGFSTSGLFSIIDKKIDEGTYYFYVKDPNDKHVIKIKCTKDIYSELIIDDNVLYTLSYKWLSYNVNKGVLNGKIDTTDIIDNR